MSADNIKCEALGKYISIVYRQGNAFLTKKFSKYNLSSGQYMFLIQLYAKDGLSQEELSYKLNIDKGTTARAIQKLEQEGYIIRIKDEKDKRTNRIYLTEKAKEIRIGFFDILINWNNILTSGLTEDEVEIAIMLMKKIAYNNLNETPTHIDS
ncbi:DNA-binding transcriptional regulator, MarR family [Clostridium cavendishii DSM 21758]|uniref:DNA-binding transcriptional regulator, MarR family n=1 Tax=Clostridium cavendishii DSM 21758 TaxID=1121302 RepID=A0A1M6PFN9_9CLOT|nr:MarR family transcriptional regulator [Clostridium cavendishii]SHK06769.1 DNA-binding transcriptional regulator, MarR family [Clostridium cavendishii DSM 21758]